MKHGVLTSCRLAFEQFDGQPSTQFFITLTYRPGADWERKQIASFCDRLRKWAERQGLECAYVWKLELTQKGKPHYHVAFWVEGVVYLPKLDDAGFWIHGFTRVERLRNGVAYMAKYLAKAEVLALPPGARLWGFGGLSGERRGELRWWRSPRWLRKFVPLEDGVRRLKGGWWSNATTNWSYKSPFEYDGLFHRFVYVGWDRFRLDMSGLVARLNGVLTTEEDWQACYA